MIERLDKIKQRLCGLRAHLQVLHEPRQIRARQLNHRRVEAVLADTRPCGVRRLPERIPEFAKHHQK